jgi:DNA-binding transcriptional ArsR family regulator
MDPFDARILSVLKESKPLDFVQLVRAVGFSHNTVRSHLARLERQGMIAKGKFLEKGRGRPVLVYSLPPEIKQRVSLTLTDPSITIVSVTFQKLKHLCRFEKGGYCKQRRSACAPQTCPQIIKGK